MDHDGGAGQEGGLDHVQACHHHRHAPGDLHLAHGLEPRGPVLTGARVELGPGLVAGIDIVLLSDLVLGKAVLDLRLNGQVDLPGILLVHSLQVLGEQHVIIACGHSLQAHETRVARPPDHNVPLTGDPDPVEAPVGGGHTRLYSGQYTLHGAHGADSQLARGGLQSAVEELTVLLETEVHRHHAASLAITTH